mmetsp:Transcript_28911/g.56269  ORF Transcript_28911/g.56269 Transcript_28911/m.56269 type:complete len:240 (-) Transcript_28911:57-776(-)
MYCLDSLDSGRPPITTAYCIPRAFITELASFNIAKEKLPVFATGSGTSKPKMIFPSRLILYMLEPLVKGSFVPSSNPTCHCTPILVTPFSSGRATARSSTLKRKLAGSASPMTYKWLFSCSFPLKTPGYRVSSYSMSSANRLMASSICLLFQNSKYSRITRPASSSAATAASMAALSGAAERTAIRLSSGKFGRLRVSDCQRSSRRDSPSRLPLQDPRRIGTKDPPRTRVGATAEASAR